MVLKFVIERNPQGQYYVYPVSKAQSTREAGGKTYTTYDRPTDQPIKPVRDMKEARSWIRRVKGVLKEVVDLTTWTAEQLPARFPWITKKQARDIVRDGETYRKKRLKNGGLVRQRPLHSSMGRRRRM